MARPVRRQLRLGRHDIWGRGGGLQAESDTYRVRHGNNRGKGDHRFEGEREETYTFSTA